jgi:ABC-2 type transport system ATP-binding protein
LRGAVARLEDVWVRYGSTTALAGVSLEVGEGLTLLLGPNGSGKTTLLRVMAGLRRPERGRVVVAGADVYAGIIPRRPPVAGLVGEEMLPYWLTARDYIEYSAAIAGVDLGEALGVAERLGLGEFLAKRTWALSSGNRKKLLLAIALASPGKMLLIDEPLANLDPASAALVSEILVEESRRRPVVAATHIMTPGLGRASRVILLQAGRVAGDYDPRRPGRVRAPVFRARLELPPEEALRAARELGAVEVVVRPGEGVVYALLSGEALEDCLERGLCREYTVDPARLAYLEGHAGGASAATN